MKKMKLQIGAALLCGGMLVFGFVGCGPVVPTEQPSVSEESVFPSSSNSEPSLGLNPEDEPPIPDEFTKMPLPDFLDEEQQRLYLRAYTAYSFFMNGTYQVDSLVPLPEGAKRGPEGGVTIDGHRYDFSTGRYQYWHDFEAMILSIYTKDFFDQLNTADNAPIFRDYEGRLCDRDFAGSEDSSYDTPDAFQLVGSAKEEVNFLVIQHFHDYHPSQAIHPHPRETDLKEGDDYTEAHPVTMVLTKDGWRVSQYHRSTMT